MWTYFCWKLSLTCYRKGSHRWPHIVETLCYLTHWSPRRKITAVCAHTPLPPAGTCELLIWTWGSSRGNVAMQTDGQEDQHARAMRCVSGIGWLCLSTPAGMSVQQFGLDACAWDRRDTLSPHHCSTGHDELGTYHLYGVYMVKALSWHYLIKQYSTLQRVAWPSLCWWENRWEKLCVLAINSRVRILPASPSSLPGAYVFKLIYTKGSVC